MHVPPHLDPFFARKPLHWAKLCLPGEYVATTIETQRVAPWGDPEGNADAFEAELMVSKPHYMLKCAPAALEGDLDLVR